METTAEITTAVKNVPALRFPEFEGEWEVDELGDIARVTSGGTPNRAKPSYWNGNVPWITTSLIDFNIIEDSEEYITEQGVKNSSAKLFPVGTILMAMYGQGKTRGKVGILGIEASTNQACAAIIATDNIYNVYLYQNLAGRYDEIRELSNEGGQQNLSGGIIKQIKISYPSLPEQQKIATFLSAADEKIQQLMKKKELLERYKKGVMQRLFSSELGLGGLKDERMLGIENQGDQILKSSHPKNPNSDRLRFKDDNGNDYPAWEVKRLGEVFERVKSKNAENNKNVLTISAQQGLINQEDFFNKSVSAENVTGYYLLHKGDFAYNKSYSKGYPMGAIKRLTKYDKGVVSTLYICFKVKDGSSEEYFEQYFNSAKLNRELHKIAQEGARNHGLLNMSVVEFFNDIKLPIPCKEEQTKIANFLTSLDKKIEVTGKQLEEARRFKKGLLQQMFV